MSPEKPSEDPKDKPKKDEPTKPRSSSIFDHIVFSPETRKLAERIQLEKSELQSFFLAPSLAASSGPAASSWRLSSFAPKSQREIELEQKTAELTAESHKLRDELAVRSREGKELEGTLAKLKDKLSELEKTNALNFIIGNIHPEARDAFLASEEFQQSFQKPCDAFVMAVDLRRSTELMLKARESQLFARFISQLSNGLRRLVLTNHGVFEKFTGDGILAFFPDFYTGPESGYFAIAAAEQCQAFFRTHYKASYACFESVLSPEDVGLGIGIDYGQISLERVGDELSIVGRPVVYACRMASTRAGTTVVNQRAYEKINSTFSGLCSLTEGFLEVKHEAKHVVYFVKRNNEPYTPSEPAWKKFVKVETQQ